MRIGRMLHAAFLVTDIERARAFYGGVLRLREKPRPAFTYAGAWYEVGDLELHLMQTQAAPPTSDERPQRDFHVAFTVADFDDTLRELERTGVSFKMSQSGRRAIFLCDPDGNQIELQEGPEIPSMP